VVALPVEGTLVTVLLVAFSEAGVMVLDVVEALTVAEEVLLVDSVAVAVVLLHLVAARLLQATERKDSMDPDNDSDPEPVELCLQIAKGSHYLHSVLKHIKG